MVEIINGTVAPELKDELFQICRLFWQTLADRDIEKRFTLCADFVTFIGTGLNEKASNKVEYKEIGYKGIEQLPQKFQIEVLWNRLTVIDDVAWIENEVEWQLPIGRSVSKELIRNTVILKKMEGRWLIVHVHGSIPDYKLSGQNYMTSEDAVKKNRELEGLVYQRTKDLDDSLKSLKEMQAQLIQSEKMASLGELTAGIAHEIQNPLNFVNNFSELNTELISEMKEELTKGNLDGVKMIVENINDNEKKIIFHGKRADGIVKGMLQHSRESSNAKELTDINKLADECLRLAYHGLRAKDKSFNAKFETSYDESLPRINVVPQDIGRVILNLLNNAFYAASKVQPTENKSMERIPTVWIKTQLSAGRVLVSIKDNGPGIPPAISTKIFQPFFTTKPTGEGTGLGLSLSYDIMKVHGGEVKVDSKEGEFAEFTLIIPV